MSYFCVVKYLEDNISLYFNKLIVIWDGSQGGFLSMNQDTVVQLLALLHS